MGVTGRLVSTTYQLMLAHATLAAKTTATSTDAKSFMTNLH
jgi:hypothetical protein